jgi:Bacterial protein of unknown function (DUF885)
LPIRRAALVNGAAATPFDVLCHDLFAFDLRQRLRTAEFPDALLAIDALFRGPTVSIPIVLEIAPVTTVRDYENLLARLRGAANVIDQTIALLDEGLRRGVTQLAWPFSFATRFFCLYCAAAGVAPSVSVPPKMTAATSVLVVNLIACPPSVG